MLWYFVALFVVFQSFFLFVRYIRRSGAIIYVFIDCHSYILDAVDTFCYSTHLSVKTLNFTSFFWFSLSDLFRFNLYNSFTSYCSFIFISIYIVLFYAFKMYDFYFQILVSILLSLFLSDSTPISCSEKSLVYPRLLSFTLV